MEERSRKQQERIKTLNGVEDRSRFADNIQIIEFQTKQKKYLNDKDKFAGITERRKGSLRTKQER